MSRIPLITAALFMLCVVPLSPQVRPSFEVTSVRANTSGDTRASMQFTPSGDFTAVNQPVRVLLNFAFQLPLFRVEGMPRLVYHGAVRRPRESARGPVD